MLVYIYFSLFFSSNFTLLHLCTLLWDLLPHLKLLLQFVSLSMLTFIIERVFLELFLKHVKFCHFRNFNIYIRFLLSFDFCSESFPWLSEVLVREFLCLLDSLWICSLTPWMISLLISMFTLKLFLLSYQLCWKVEELCTFQVYLETFLCFYSSNFNDTENIPKFLLS